MFSCSFGRLEWLEHQNSLRRNDEISVIVTPPAEQAIYSCTMNGSREKQQVIYNIIIILSIYIWNYE